MGELILVRHGQANTTARDEASYDQLSVLGQQQAAWLGQHFRDHHEAFDQIWSGSLNRHRETLSAMGDLGIGDGVDARLNELDYFNLAHALQDDHGVPMPANSEDFAAHLPQVMAAWHRAEISGNERFAEFEARIGAILQAVSQEGQRVLCVTSGGVIAMAIRLLLRLDTDGFSAVLLPIRNTSVHRVMVRPGGNILLGFNEIPHLNAPDRAHARTVV